MTSLALVDVGLGYLGLGKPGHTVGRRTSAAEARQLQGEVRAPSARPTSRPGLPPGDVDKLLGLLDQLVDNGNTVIVIEHHQAVIVHADWVIDLGRVRATKVAASPRARPVELVDAASTDAAMLTWLAPCLVRRGA